MFETCTLRHAGGDSFDAGVGSSFDYGKQILLVLQLKLDLTGVYGAFITETAHGDNWAMVNINSER
ncbi:hypothetical protein DXX93_07370 [Thalassotalea euphylliae]|uniref:Uncharacterized protein n=1 Tax=Thalassotalea euphylliae TaxID=1655234 RepID=A0A3E0TR46_9GAMM|nr:hypothetical protein DXX93_07370 [Thalassotalea euphylliae]